MTIWRAVRCLRPCDRPASTLLVMLEQLIIRVNEVSHSHYSLSHEIESDGMESWKVSKIL